MKINDSLKKNSYNCYIRTEQNPFQRHLHIYIRYYTLKIGMELPLGFSKSLWHVSLTFVKSSGPANFLEMPTRSITAPGVNFRSAAPGSRGSFGCFGIRPDQSTSITSSGSTKSYRIFLHQEIPFLLSSEKYRLKDTGKQTISNLNKKRHILKRFSIKTSI